LQPSSHQIGLYLHGTSATLGRRRGRTGNESSRTAGYCPTGWILEHIIKCDPRMPTSRNHTQPLGPGCTPAGQIDIGISQVQHMAGKSPGHHRSERARHVSSKDRRRMLELSTVDAKVGKSSRINKINSDRGRGGRGSVGDRLFASSSTAEGPNENSEAADCVKS
jgi:hypothetical protein